MAYATHQDMIERFGEQELIRLTDRDGTAGAIVASVLDRALGDATAVIDAHLQSAGYSLPLAADVALLTSIAVDLGRAKLYDENPTETVLAREKNALALLQRIASGALKLGLPAAATPVTSDEAIVESAGSVWARERSKGFM